MLLFAAVAKDYAFSFNAQRCCFCAGKCTQIQVLPDSNSAGQSHMACKLLHSSKQAAFVLFYRVLEGGGKGALLHPGTLEWTLIPEVKLGEEKSMTWTLPGTLPLTPELKSCSIDGTSPGAQQCIPEFLKCSMAAPSSGVLSNLLYGLRPQSPPPSSLVLF